MRTFVLLIAAASTAASASVAEALVERTFEEQMMERIPPGTSPGDWKHAVELAEQIKSRNVNGFKRTDHPEAMWFPDATLGLFMHWGIHSVAGLQPSWAMIKDYPYGGTPEFHPPEKYYALADKFDPQQYDPDEWLKPAKAMGAEYAVLTTKHHDGYTLWPSKYGAMGTHVYLDGRDLLKPYVEACRRRDMKVGFYFSPRDWWYPNFPVAMDHADRGTIDQVGDTPEENRLAFEAFYAYTVAQLEEILTRYGDIDVLWFDGMGWPQIEDPYAIETMDWIRELQPGIVINDRWRAWPGDYETPEMRLPEGKPEGWWETCTCWNGHWGYNAERPFRPTGWVLEQLASTRKWGGNLLINVGPSPEGPMPDGYEDACAQVAAWMEHSGESLLRAGESPGEEYASVPITTGNNTWYLHVLPAAETPVQVQLSGRQPETVKLLRTGQDLHWAVNQNSISIDLPDQARTDTNDVIEIVWQE
jgi:alpha-L-fucosidase